MRESVPEDKAVITDKGWWGLGGLEGLEGWERGVQKNDI